MATSCLHSCSELDLGKRPDNARSILGRDRWDLTESYRRLWRKAWVSVRLLSWSATSRSQALWSKAFTPPIVFLHQFQTPLVDSLNFILISGRTSLESVSIVLRFDILYEVFQNLRAIYSSPAMLRPLYLVKTQNGGKIVWCCVYVCVTA